MNESVKQYRQLLLQKVKTATADVENCINKYLFFSTGDRQGSVETARESVRQVREMIAEKERPQWLTALQDSLEYAAAQKNSNEGAKSIYRVATELYPAMKAYDWKGFYENSELEVGLNVDAIYAHCRLQYGVQEHFEKIIEHLKTIANSGEIDSIRLRTELLKIVDTLEHSKDGSYFATHSSFDFLKLWMKKTAWGNLAKLPIVGPTIRALEETVKETGVTLAQVEQQFYRELQEKIAGDFPQLGFQLPSLPLVLPNEENVARRVTENGDCL